MERSRVHRREGHRVERLVRQLFPHLRGSRGAAGRDRRGGLSLPPGEERVRAAPGDLPDMERGEGHSPPWNELFPQRRAGERPEHILQCVCSGQQSALRKTPGPRGCQGIRHLHRLCRLRSLRVNLAAEGYPVHLRNSGALRLLAGLSWLLPGKPCGTIGAQRFLLHRQRGGDQRGVRARMARVGGRNRDGRNRHLDGQRQGAAERPEHCGMFGGNLLCRGGLALSLGQGNLRRAGRAEGEGPACPFRGACLR